MLGLREINRTTFIVFKFNKRDPLQLCNLPKKTDCETQDWKPYKTFFKERISGRMKKERQIFNWNFAAWIIAIQAEIFLVYASFNNPR